MSTGFQNFPRMKFCVFVGALVCPLLPIGDLAFWEAFVPLLAAKAGLHLCSPLAS